MAAVKVCQYSVQINLHLSWAKRRLGFPALAKISLGHSSRSTAGPEVLTSFGLTTKLLLPSPGADRQWLVLRDRNFTEFSMMGYSN